MFEKTFRVHLQEPQVPCLFREAWTPPGSWGAVPGSGVNLSFLSLQEVQLMDCKGRAATAAPRSDGVSSRVPDASRLQ